MWMPNFRLTAVFRRFLINREFLCKKHTAHKPLVFSGIQPTGVPHLGNYFGAIKKWSILQNEGEKCIFSIVDLHSITLPQDPLTLRQNIHIMAACLLACGINPDLSVFFLQSQVPYHTELAWILGCMTTTTRLTHLPQYKEKAGSVETIPLGLYIYPILQSADILLYKATKVPVGEDQIQHIQLCQHLVKVFNNKYGKIFPVPSALIEESSARIKSLRQPEKKMSKSDSNIRNRIEITDPPDMVTKRIKEAVTDCTSAVTYDMEQRPGVSNLILIHSLCTGKSCQSICDENRNLDTGQYKGVVAEAVVEYLKPIRLEFQRLMAEPSYIVQILQKGSEKASEIARQTIDEVKKVVGLTHLGRS
ncbi:tryptophan--tRNA ligase, mitochondrial [Trichonephila clavipes]|uniref:Tryptophan--tRNA ligase, mitochondrial n=1 Tax=Trichonephila clavipes TaxID=2585209 RepID=A0A8X6WFD6_TRICX|nr:tryptophan--tRNA ligase, mitochondrial [Trichonephila clavipes]